MDSNKLYIVDSSVLIKWYNVNEVLVDEALRVRNAFLEKKIHIHLPILCMWEFCNFFGRNYDVNTASSILANLQNYKLPSFHLNFTVSNLAFQIMEKLKNVSFYDASYHALAIHQNGTFLTCDKRYVEKAAEFGHIQLLSDYC